MITFLNRNQIEEEKYNTCIKKSIQSRIYAFSWYLDIVADNWSILVLNDYEAVMPLPWKQKYLISYITQPFFCQQLGVFSLKEIGSKEAQDFINKIPKKFLKVALNFNSENRLEGRVLKKENYILSLEDTHEVLFRAFNKGRKHAVKSGAKNELKIESIKTETLIQIKKENYKYTRNSKVNFELLNKISDYIQNHNKGIVMGVFKNDVALGGAIILNDTKRITYLFSSFTEEGKKLQAPSFLINQLIKQYSNSDLLLDFEGSMLPNVASFYRSFGAVKEIYSFYKKTTLPLY